MPPGAALSRLAGLYSSHPDRVLAITSLPASASLWKAGSVFNASCNGFFLPPAYDRNEEGRRAGIRYCWAVREGHENEKELDRHGVGQVFQDSGFFDPVRKSLEWRSLPG